MRTSTILLLIILAAVPAAAQHHFSNWVHRNAMDTTIVQCENDTIGMVHFPPSSMGMMLPDSMYCEFEIMPMDSMPFVHDSTMIEWCRLQMGSDSMHFDIMNCDSGSNGHPQMGMMRDLECEFHWDSLLCDSLHRNWHPTGLKGWNGTSWVSISGVSITDNVASFSSRQMYSAFVFIGEPANPTSVEDIAQGPVDFKLLQNYPNPFNPATTIEFSVPRFAVVTLNIYNTLGQKVAELVSGEVAQGLHSVTWDARNVASGTYYARLQSSDGVAMMKLLLLK